MVDFFLTEVLIALQCIMQGYKMLPPIVSMYASASNCCHGKGVYSGGWEVEGNRPII